MPTCPADAAIASLHELHMRRYELQDRRRIMTDDIVEGRDELGCLVMGHPFKSWWIGSLLDIHESRRMVPRQNATTLQVAASVLAAVKWMMENPRAGVRCPTTCPTNTSSTWPRPTWAVRLHAGRLDAARRLGRSFAGYGRSRPSDADVWQFTTFLV